MFDIGDILWRFDKKGTLANNYTIRNNVERVMKANKTLIDSRFASDLSKKELLFGESGILSDSDIDFFLTNNFSKIFIP